MGFGAAATPREGTLDGGAAPPLPLYILEVLGAANTRVNPLPGAALPLSSSSLAVLGEALLEYHAPHYHHAVMLLLDGVFLKPLPLSLLDQGMGDVTGLYVC